MNRRLTEMKATYGIFSRDIQVLPGQQYAESSLFRSCLHKRKMVQREATPGT